MKNYNPMSMFDNSKPVFNTIKAKQNEYKLAVRKVEQIKQELTKMWKKISP